jgi:hypothetical protein
MANAISTVVAHVHSRIDAERERASKPGPTADGDAPVELDDFNRPDLKFAEPPKGEPGDVVVDEDVAPVTPEPQPQPGPNPDPPGIKVHVVTPPVIETSPPGEPAAPRPRGFQIQQPFFVALPPGLDKHTYMLALQFEIRGRAYELENHGLIERLDAPFAITRLPKSFPMAERLESPNSNVEASQRAAQKAADSSERAARIEADRAEARRAEMERFQADRERPG